VTKWATCVFNKLGLAGFDLDGAKHICRGFLIHLVVHLKKTFNRDLFESLMQPSLVSHKR